MFVIGQALLVGVTVLLVGSIPRDLIFAANLRFFPALPWAVPVSAALLWLFWRYVRGDGPPASTSEERRRDFRATPLPARTWTWALLAGSLGLVALVIALRVANRMVALPVQATPDLEGVPQATSIALIVMGAAIAGVVEEAAFRGYMQRAIELRYGLVIAILITGTVFALVHLDFRPILWPYYVAVSAIYGTVAYLADSILPAVLLHTAGNIYSNFYLWFFGRAEWQASASSPESVWRAGVDAPFAILLAELLLVALAMAFAFQRLARVCRVATTSSLEV